MPWTGKVLTMCECGCTSNDERYSFPGPGKTLYLLTLSKGCESCDAGPGITIERFQRKASTFDLEFIDGTLPFEEWPDSEGVAIICGFRKHEFVKAMRQHLTDTPVDELDESGAEVVLEEMYSDSVFRPRFPVKEDSR
jgi:hypothetical protein